MPRPERAITREDVAARYNNFYEFGGSKDVWRNVGAFRTDRWPVDVTGLVAKPRVWTLEEILRLPCEERIYRHRCVEAWAMHVPWRGFPLSRLLRIAKPRHAARLRPLRQLRRPRADTGHRRAAVEPLAVYRGTRD